MEQVFWIGMTTDPMILTKLNRDCVVVERQKQVIETVMVCTIAMTTVQMTKKKLDRVGVGAEKQI